MPKRTPPVPRKVHHNEQAGSGGVGSNKSSEEGSPSSPFAALSLRRTRFSSVPLVQIKHNVDPDEITFPASVELPRRHVTFYSDVDSDSSLSGGGLCSMSDTMESFKDVGGTTVQPSVRIKHLTRNSDGSSRFPKLDECAHFHYDNVELGPVEVALCAGDESIGKGGDQQPDEGELCVRVSSNGKSWQIRRSVDHFQMLDRQLHRCVYDRKFSLLPDIQPQQQSEDALRIMLTQYLERFSQLAGSLINCGPVLNWLELDNRGNRLIVTDEAAINTPAVAAAYVIKRYASQAPDEISLEVGDIISVIDMPPPEESSWWRGKKGFQVGFFPCECVEIIGDKVPQSFKMPKAPSKPVLRKHGKLIAFFRSFLLSRPSRRKLKQSGILKERVFGCDLGEHLMNSGRDIPLVLKCCTEFIEQHGIVDGIYRLSGVTSNIQKLRLAFDEERVPNLLDEAILQDIHCVASLLKMYFRELPNPLLTFHLYDKFVNAVQADESVRLLRLRDVVQQLPPPHYRSLEFLMRHLSKVAAHGPRTGMTPKNVAIVWAPNLLRSRDIENGGVGALHVVGVQAVLTEYLIRYTDIIFSEKMPVFPSPKLSEVDTPKKTRPKSLAISTPTKLLSLEEARSRALTANLPDHQKFIDVGGGEENLPVKYHTVIELPARRRSVGKGGKKSPSGWKTFFSRGWHTTSGRRKNRRGGRGVERPKIGSPIFCEHSPLVPQDKAVTESDVSHTNSKKLRTVKSAEALYSLDTSLQNSREEEDDLTEEKPNGGCEEEANHLSSLSISSKQQHTRSISHDSYFERTPADYLLLEDDDNSSLSRPKVKKQKLQEDPSDEVSSPKLQKLTASWDDTVSVEINQQQQHEEMDVSMEATVSESAARVSQLLSFDGSLPTPDSPTGDNLSDIPSSTSGDSPMSDGGGVLVDQTRQLHIDHPSTLPSPVVSQKQDGSFDGDIILSPPESFVDPSRSPEGLSREVAKSPDVVAKSPDVVAKRADVIKGLSQEVAKSPNVVAKRADVVEGLSQEVAKSPDVVAKCADVVKGLSREVAKSPDVVAERADVVKGLSQEVAKSPDVAKDLASEIRAQSRSPCARPLERSKTEVHEICLKGGVPVSGSFGQELFKANSEFVEAHIFSNSKKHRGGDKPATSSPVSPIEDTKRKFESEIGRLIVRDRQMKLEMERMKAERQKRRAEVSSISESPRKQEFATELQKSPIRNFEAERKNSEDFLRTIVSVEDSKKPFVSVEDSNKKPVVSEEDNIKKPVVSVEDSIKKSVVSVEDSNRKTVVSVEDIIKKPVVVDVSPSNDYSRYIRMRNKPSVKELLSKFENQKKKPDNRSLDHSSSGVFSNVQVNFPLTSSKSFASSLEPDDNRKEHIFQTECVIRFPHPKSSKLSTPEKGVDSRHSKTTSSSSPPGREQQQHNGGGTPSFSSFADTFHRATAQMRTEFLQRGLPPSSNGFESSSFHCSRSPPEVRKKPVATRQRPKSVPPPVCRLSYAPPVVVSNGQGSSSQTFGPPKRVKDRAAIFERSLSFSGSSVDKRTFPPRQKGQTDPR